jgi:hypothetical protein
MKNMIYKESQEKTKLAVLLVLVNSRLFDSISPMTLLLSHTQC